MSAGCLVRYPRLLINPRETLSFDRGTALGSAWDLEDDSKKRTEDRDATRARWLESRRLAIASAIRAPRLIKQRQGTRESTCQSGLLSGNLGPFKFPKGIP
jgi:hypothetical protein